MLVVSFQRLLPFPSAWVARTSKKGARGSMRPSPDRVVLARCRPDRVGTRAKQRRCRSLSPSIACVLLPHFHQDQTLQACCTHTGMLCPRTLVAPAPCLLACASSQHCTSRLNMAAACSSMHKHRNAVRLCPPHSFPFCQLAAGKQGIGTQRACLHAALYCLLHTRKGSSGSLGHASMPWQKWSALSLGRPGLHAGLAE